MTPDAPSFIGIGPSRSGTSWMYQVLRRVPGVWMPPIKELHYWDWVDGGATGRGRRWSQHLDWRARAYAGAVVAPVRRGEGRVRLAPAFDLRYFTGRRSPDWYRRVFAAAPPGAVSGEITPGYAGVGEPTVAEIARTLPQVRAIVWLRDPIDRRWSIMVKNEARDRGRSVEEVPLDVWMRRATSPGLSLPALLDRWWSALGRDRVHLAWYDTLASDPAGHLGGVLEFLGIEAEVGALVADWSRPVNAAAAGRAGPPEEVVAALARSELAGLRELADVLPDAPPVDRWLRRAAELAG